LRESSAQQTRAEARCSGFELDEVILDRGNAARAARLSLRALCLNQLLEEKRHRRLRLFAAHAWLEPPHFGGELSSPVGKILSRRERDERNPEIRFAADSLAEKAARRDANHLTGVAIHEHCATQHVRITPKLALPKRVAEHGQRPGRGAAVRDAIFV